LAPAVLQSAGAHDQHWRHHPASPFSYRPQHPPRTSPASPPRTQPHRPATPLTPRFLTPSTQHRRSAPRPAPSALAQLPSWHLQPSQLGGTWVSWWTTG